MKGLDIMTQLTTKSLTKMAVCLAIICISAYISFPIPFTVVPFTCLTLTLLLAAFLFSPKNTLIIMVTYILIGAIGLPVFAGGSGGASALVSPAGGYLWGFIISYPVASYLKGNKNSIKRFFLAGLITIPINYTCGVAMLCFVMKLSIIEGIMLGAVPFILGDVVKVFISSYLAVHLRKSLSID